MMDDIVAFLASPPPGRILDTAELERLLAISWDEFDCREGGMRGYKVLGRIEDAKWEPPILKFTIERHGAMALGSTRAELQGWALNVETKHAECGIAGRRQIHPMAARLNVIPLAEEVATKILSHQEDYRLKWNDDGSVRVLAGAVIPSGTTVKQTLQGRRKRFRNALRERLVVEGWREFKTNTYRREVQIEDMIHSQA